uniref:AraC family transcriptional regulator n=1 Tax=Stappia sp. TaxID=1870903 RepID=UPI003BABCA54
MIPNPSDPIGELLMGMRMRGASYSKLHLAPTSGVAFPACTRARFHFIACGTGLLETGTGETMPVSCGDAVLLPHGGEHALMSRAGGVVRPFESFEAMPLCPGMCALGTGPEVGDGLPDGGVLVFSAEMEFEFDTLHPLTALMPRVLHVGPAPGEEPEVRPLLDAMEREMFANRAGTAGILARLAEVVAASVVRNWVECGCGDATGWVAALRDERLGRVLAALHRDPGRDWTLADMATAMGSSRSVFAERFAAATGTTPLRYVAALRMRLAEQWLSRDRRPIDVVARELGYQSQAAFSRAYKRVTGRSPGQTRNAR